MSIEKIGSSYTTTCDICGYELPDEFDFLDAVNAKRAEGWKSRKVDGEWQDVCCNCQEDGR